MPNLSFKVTGSIRDAITIFEKNMVIDNHFHPIFSGNIDGFTITKYIFNVINAGLLFYLNGNPVTAGQEISQSDINAGSLELDYQHSYSSSFLQMTTLGQSKNEIYLTFNSGV